MHRRDPAADSRLGRSRRARGTRINAALDAIMRGGSRFSSRAHNARLALDNMFWGPSERGLGRIRMDG